MWAPSSQAPRPDESARDHYDLEMAYRHLESLDAGEDHRYMISETLRHLHIDLSGNTHRSEISFDKFWNLEWETGCRGLIEFRAIETLPHPEWMSAVALLWTCLIATLFEPRRVHPLAVHGTRLHDYYFLPSGLWKDFEIDPARPAPRRLQAQPEDVSGDMGLALPEAAWNSTGTERGSPCERRSRTGRCCAKPQWKAAHQPLRGHLDGTAGIARQ